MPTIPSLDSVPSREPNRERYRYSSPNPAVSGVFAIYLVTSSSPRLGRLIAFLGNSESGKQDRSRPDRPVTRFTSTKQHNPYTCPKAFRPLSHPPRELSSPNAARTCATETDIHANRSGTTHPQNAGRCPKPSHALRRRELLRRQVPNNPQHTRVLANDWLGTCLAALVGVSVPTPAIIKVHPWLIEHTGFAAAQARGRFDRDITIFYCIHIQDITGRCPSSDPVERR